MNTVEISHIHDTDGEQLDEFEGSNAMTLTVGNI